MAAFPAAGGYRRAAQNVPLRHSTNGEAGNGFASGFALLSTLPKPVR
jgi:hypothetical protein